MIQGEFLPTINPERAGMAVEAIDEVVKLYIDGVRRVQRKIFAAPLPMPERQHENVAEHGWSVHQSVKTLWENRRELDITFGDNFDIELAKDVAVSHDTGESLAGDPDTLREDVDPMEKRAGEVAAFRQIGSTNKYLGWLEREGIAYEQKDRPEFRFVSDVDKHTGTRVVCLYALYRWWGFGGEVSTREKHDRIMMRKLMTPLGFRVYDAIGQDFDRREIIKKEQGLLPLFPPDEQLAQDFLSSSRMSKRMAAGFQIRYNHDRNTV